MDGFPAVGVLCQWNKVQRTCLENKIPGEVVAINLSEQPSPDDLQSTAGGWGSKMSQLLI